MPEVGVGIDARNHHIHRLRQQPERSQGDTVRRRAVAGQAFGAVCQFHFLYAQRPPQGLYMPGGRPVVVRRHDRDLAQRAQLLDHGQQAGVEDAVIIGCEYMHGICGSLLSLKLP